MKRGFQAYEEIKELANKAFKGQVQTQADIFGDEYIILVDHKEILKGNTDKVRTELIKLINGGC